MFFTIEKLQRRVEELKERRYFDLSTIAPFVSMPGTLPEDEWYHELPESVTGEAFGLQDVFSGRDRYLWLEKEITVPEKVEGCESVGLFDFGETPPGYAEGFESMLYIDGHPYQGVDRNHKEVIFQGREGEKIRLTFLLWTGLEGGGPHRISHHRVKQADLGYLHKKTDELYYFSKAMIETLQILSPDDENYENLKAVLERSFACINWDRDRFYPSAEMAHDVLMSELDKLDKHTEVTVHAVGHTHIDVAFLWRLKHTREKAQRTFSTVLRMMERFDEYYFLQSQPQLYQYVKEDCPELYEKIQEKVKEGKWEPEGGMWIESDCNIPSGESLVRQLLYGTRFFEREFGKKCEYLWLPDAFGFNWALPQIMKQCELDTFATTKISWNQFNYMPDDLFKWRGIDGTEILTYFITTPLEAPTTSKWATTYDWELNPSSICKTWQRFRNKDLSKDTMIAYGYGDGGGGVSREMLEMRRAMDRIPGLPHVKTDTTGGFLKKLHENVEKTDRYIHTWDGELYLEAQRGTFTSQAYGKRMNRKMENELEQTEWLSSLAYLAGHDYDSRGMYDIWESVLLHQFHDILPGSSIHEVYEDAKKYYSTAENKAACIKEQALKNITEQCEHTYGVYSGNSFRSRESVFLPVKESGYFRNPEGEILKAYRTEQGYEVCVETEPFSVTNITFVPGKEQKHEAAFEIHENTLETPYYTISWNEEGQIIDLYDKTAERSVLKEGAKGNVLEIYEDKPMSFDAWDIDIFYQQKMEVISACRPAEILEVNGAKAVIRFFYKYHNSEIIQDMTAYREMRRIDFKTHVDWHEDHRLLKAAFYTDIRSTKATYDIQFGHIERPTHWNNSWDWAKFEVCGQKWADLSETGYGVSILNDCKYGYSIKDNAMKISLLKSAKYPDTEADMGEHDFTYALYPHTGSVLEGGTIEAANQMNLPAQTVQGRFKDLRRMIQVTNNGIQIDAVKKAEDEDAVIVRMHECRGGHQKTRISSEFPVTRMVPCNLLEHDSGESFVGNTASVEFRPFEIKTFKLFLKNGMKNSGKRTGEPV